MTHIANKKPNQRWHAKKRAAERYGLTVNKHLLQAWIQLIQQGKSIFMERQSNRVTVHLIEHDGQRIPLVYDSKRSTIVTCLPIEYLACKRPEYSDRAH